MIDKVEKIGVKVNKIEPSHYNDSCSLSCIDSMVIGFGYINAIYFCVMNAYKYIWRFRHKNGLEDLEKAERYLDMAQHIYEDFDDDYTEEMTRAIDKVHCISKILDGLKEKYYGSDSK